MLIGNEKKRRLERERNAKLFKEIEETVDILKEKIGIINSLEQRINSLEQKIGIINSLEQRINSLEQKISDFEDKFAVKRSYKKVKKVKK